MSNLSTQQINTSFPGLLQVPGGITSTLQTVQDGNGNNTGLQISTTGINAGTVSSSAITNNGTVIPSTTIRPISDLFGDFVKIGRAHV